MVDGDPDPARTQLSVVLTGSGPELCTEPPQRPPDCPDAVLIRPDLVGVCRSDLKEISGQRPGQSQFGHEVVGLVEASSVSELPVGARVCLDPNVPLHRSSGFARWMWAGGGAQDLIRAFPLAPAMIGARRLVFAEPLACAARCLTMVRDHLGRELRSDLTVGVLGAGIAGVLIAALAEQTGAGVRLINRGRDRLEFLVGRGVLPHALALDPRAVPAAGHDVVVLATSFVLPELLEWALRLVRPGGLVMLYGGTQRGDRLSGLDCDLDTVRRAQAVTETNWHGKPVLIGGSYGTTTEDFSTALRTLTTAPDGLGVERLVAAEVSVRHLPDTLRALAGTRQLGKVLVRPWSDG